MVYHLAAGAGREAREVVVNTTWVRAASRMNMLSSLKLATRERNN